MSKKKDQALDTEEIMVEEEPTKEETVEVIPEPVVAEVDINAFIARKMKNINNMKNKVKARSQRNRLMQNKRK